MPWVIPAAIILLLSALISALSMPLDLTRFSPRIESVIESKVTGEVEIGRVVVKVLPSPDIEITGVAAFHGGEKLFVADRVRARVSLLPLLAGKAVFQVLEISSPELVLRRDNRGRLNLSGFLARKPVKRDVSIRTLDLRDGRLTFIDGLPAGGASFEASGLDATIEQTGQAGQTGPGYSFGVEGTLLPSTPLAFSGKINGKGEVEGRGSVDGLMLSGLNPYLRDRSPDASLEGRVDLDLSYTYNDAGVLRASFSYTGMAASFPSVFTGPVYSRSGSGKLALSTGEAPGLSVEDVEMNMAGFTASGRFGLSGPKGGRIITAEGSTTPVPLRAIKDMLPLKAMPGPAASMALAIEPLGGSVTIKEFRVEGRADELKGGAILKRPGSALLAVSVRDASFTHRGLKKPFQNISGDLSFKDNRLSFSGFSGRYSKEVVGRLRGSVRDMLEAAPFELSLSGSLDIGETLAIAKGLSKGALSRRLSKAEARGAVSVNASLSGALRGKRPLKYSGDANIKNGAFRYDGAPVGIDSLGARLSFDNERVRLHESNAVSGGSRIAVTGAVEGYGGKAPRFDLNAKGALSGETLLKLARGPVEDMKLDGAVPFTLSAAGSPEDFSASASVDATSAGVFLGPYIGKRAGFPLKAEAEAERKGARITVNRAAVAFGSSSIGGRGSFLQGREAYSLSIGSDKMLIADIDEVSPFFNNAYASEGAVFLSVTAEKSPGAKPAYNGSVGITDGRFKMEALPGPVQNANARADFEGNRASVVIHSLSTGSTSMEGRVEVLDIAQREVRFELDFPRLHAGDLMPKKKKAGDEKKTDRLKINGAGTIRAAEGDLWGHRFTSFSSEVAVDSQLVLFHPASVNIDQGRASGSIGYFLGEAEPLLFTIDMRLADIDLETMLAAFGARKKVLSGRAGADILFSAARGASPFARGLNGSATVSSGKGRLWKFGFLSDIFSIVNIVSIDEILRGAGLQHKGIEGHFQLLDGVLSTGDLVLDSDTMRMSAVGEIDLAERKIDSTLALHPFVTIDKIISIIPLAGWIIAGEEESAVSLYFGLEGPLKDPDVTPMPVKSISENVFGILRRLLRTPLRIFE